MYEYQDCDIWDALHTGRTLKNYKVFTTLVLKQIDTRSSVVFLYWLKKEMALKFHLATLNTLFCTTAVCILHVAFHPLLPSLHTSRRRRKRADSRSWLLSPRGQTLISASGTRVTE